MLALARHRPGGERVRWVLGDVSKLTSHRADMAFMAGHVAQFFIADADWHPDRDGRPGRPCGDRAALRPESRAGVAAHGSEAHSSPGAGEGTRHPLWLAIDVEQYRSQPPPVGRPPKGSNGNSP